MDCHIEWDSSKVVDDELIASLEPSPDFAFMMEFDGVVDPIKSHHDGWGRVLIAQGKVVVSDVQPDAAQELRAFLDQAVQEANRLAVDNRVRAQQKEQAEAAAAAERETQKAAAAAAEAKRDEKLTDAFRGDA